MKKLICVVLLLSSVSAFTQKADSWKVFHNRKEVENFKLDDTNDEHRVVLLNRSLEEPGFVIITYTPMSDQKNWKRTFFITDANGTELKKIEGKEFRVHNSEIARYLESREKILIYTSAIPDDPAQAATVRVRRILLASIYTR